MDKLLITFERSRNFFHEPLLLRRMKPSLYHSRIRKLASLWYLHTAELILYVNQLSWPLLLHCV